MYPLASAFGGQSGNCADRALCRLLTQAVTDPLRRRYLAPLALSVGRIIAQIFLPFNLTRHIIERLGVE